MKEFFKVTDLQSVLEYRTKFPQVKTEEIPLVEAVGRILAKDMVADDDPSLSNAQRQHRHGRVAGD